MSQDPAASDADAGRAGALSSSGAGDNNATRAEGSAETVVLSFPDVNGVLRGKAFSAKAYASVRNQNCAVFTDLLLALDPQDQPITTFENFGITSGASDLIVRPDESTLRLLPWLSSTALCLGDLYWGDGDTCRLSSRDVLKRSLERLAGLGYEALSAFEFEVRVFAGSFGTPAAPGPSYGVAALAPLEEFVDEVRHACEGLGLGLAAVHTEGAPGLLELNLEPRLGILAADEAVLLRLVLKEIGRRRDLSVSFMAKPVAGEEGSSGHLHCSLWHRDGRSAFAGSAEPGAPTPLLRQSIAGIVRHLPAMSLLYNPNLNSYKRLLPGFFAPVSACWGFDNRSAAVRVIRPAQADGTHIELRTPGADVNPYLALAGLVGSICVGIESDLVPPSPIGHVDASTASGELAAPLPSSLEAAIGAFKADAGARHALGEEFSNYYLVTRDWELRAWQRIVTDWERQRYAFTT